MVKNYHIRWLRFTGIGGQTKWNMQKRVARPKLKWFQSSIRKATKLPDYAYCAQLEDEVDSDYLPIQRIVNVERYGGSGIGVNGGDVRCGYFDGISTKGMRRSSLAGKDAPFWHSYGGASLRDGIREVILGEYLTMRCLMAQCKLRALSRLELKYL